MWSISGEEMWNGSNNNENKGFHYENVQYVLGQRLGLKRKFLGSPKALKKDKKFRESFDSLIVGFLKSHGYCDSYHSNSLYAHYNDERIKNYKTEYIGDGVLRFYKGKYEYVFSNEKREFELSLNDLVFKGYKREDLSLKYLDLSSYQKLYDLLVDEDEMIRVED